MELPSSKSLAHRALIIASIVGKSTVKNVTFGDDINATLVGIKALNGTFCKTCNTVLMDTPINATINTVTMYLGDSASSLRFFLALSSALGQPAFLTGSPSLLSRPMLPLIETLSVNGAEIVAKKDGFLVTGRLHSGVYSIGGDISSQYLSALLMALPLLLGGSKIVLTTPLTSVPYVDLTLQVMENFGVQVQNDNYKTFTLGGTHYLPNAYTVEADFSAAAFFLVAGVLYKKVSAKNLNLQSHQGDKAIIDIIRQAGGTIYCEDDALVAVPSSLCGIDVDLTNTPDLAPIVAVLLSLAKGISRLYGTARLRYKECDREAGIVENLTAIGGKMKIKDNYFEITGVPFFAGGDVKTHGDHRLAMSMAIASLKSSGKINIDDKDCVRKSFPTFWDEFDLLTK